MNWMGAVDFAVLPPEINSGRMYAGPGSAPMTAAAAAWDRLAAQLSSAAGSYQTVITELTDDPWRGSAATAMVAAANPYLAWMRATAARAEQAATRARAAATAYRQAFAAVVPPPVVAANRAALAALAATNTLGQNAAAIAANQADYAEMWARDAAAMHTYATGSAAAASLTPFTAPPQDTGPAGNGGPATAAQAPPPGPLTQVAQAIVTNPTVEALNKFLETQNSLTSVLADGTVEAQLEYMVAWPAWTGAATANVGYAASLGLLPGGLASSVSGAAPSFTLAGTSRLEVSAIAGRAIPVGGLSVPPSWGATPPGFQAAAPALPMSAIAGSAALPEARGHWFAGIPPVAGVVNAPASTEPRSGYLSPPAGAASGGTGVSTGQESDEVAELRRKVLELTKDCELLESSAHSLLTEAGVLPVPPQRHR